MLSTLKTINSLALFLVISLAFSVLATPSKAYAQNKIIRKNDVLDVIRDKNGTVFSLYYSPKTRLIWVYSNNKGYRLKVHSLERNANPELVGSEGEIKFLTREVINQSGRQFIGLTFAERSMRGNGMGQCGAGAEVYFVAIEITGPKIFPINQFKVESCIEGIDLDSRSEAQGEAIKLNEKNKVIFRWLSYPNFEKPVTGVYEFSANQLKLRENGSPYDWVEF